MMINSKDTTIYNRVVFVNLKNDKGTDDDETSEVLRMQCLLGAFILSHSKKVLHRFEKSIDWSKTKRFYYQDTNLLYFEKKQKLVETGFIVEDKIQAEIDYGDGVFFLFAFETQN